MSDPVDLDRLREFSDGTDEGLRALARLFLADSDETVVELAGAVDRRAAAEIQFLAHRARGSVAACGAARLAEILLEMESLALQGRAADAASMMPSVERELREVQTFVSASLLSVG